MPTAAFATLGCKVNQYETQRILDSFEERGFAITEWNAPADVYVVNTCSVTQTAEGKSRQMVRRLARTNPDAVVVMTGCYGEMARLKGEALPEADLVVRNPDKLRTLDEVLAAFPNLTPSTDDALTAATRKERYVGGRTRATVKVQDGCDVRCSFCSIPYTRAVMQSRPSDEILAEVRDLALRGNREVVVTGVLVGSYGLETGSAGPDLAELLLRIARTDGIERVRLSSIEPTQVTDRLLDAFVGDPRLCNHLHIPLQSGDSGVLHAMNRPYDRDFYLRLCERAYRMLPGLAITTDILVGFPTEDHAGFENTLGVVRQVGFARTHIFRYSPRPGTPAALMADCIGDAEKTGRSHMLAEECSVVQRRYIGRYLGRTLPVLVEGKPEDGGLLSGYTENYIRVRFAGGSHLVGTVCPVVLEEVTSDSATGEARSAYQPEADVIPLALANGTASTRR